MKKLLAVVLLMVLFLANCGGPSFRGSVLDEPVDVPDWTLYDQHGDPFRLSDQQGNVVLLFFGYTSCPDVCPTTLATWRKIHEALGDKAQRRKPVVHDTVEGIQHPSPDHSADHWRDDPGNKQNDSP